MNLDRISDVLQNYNGQEESMQQVATVLQEELGENWTQTVFQDLQNLSPALKDNLNHAFNYYAATAAWNELQTYLTDENLTRTPEIEERLPILKHWLDFFGAPGLEAYQELEDRLAEMDMDSTPTPSPTEKTLETQDSVETTPAEEISNETNENMSTAPLDIPEESIEPTTSDTEAEESEPEQKEDILEPILPADESLTIPSDDESLTEASADESLTIAQEKEETESLDTEPDNPSQPESNKSFELEKIQKQLTLLEQNQAWLAARCVQLKNIEIYAYPFYGFIVDLLRQILKEINAMLDDESQTSLIDQQFEGGLDAFKRKKEAIEHDIELAEQNCESAVTALISDDINLEELKRTLGTIDESDTVEYIGPAPDGFELVDNETPLDETVIKQQYEKIENMDAFGDTPPQKAEKSESVQENTSQNSQKGVQRKLSFSLKKKKPTEEAT